MRKTNEITNSVYNLIHEHWKGLHYSNNYSFMHCYWPFVFSFDRSNDNNEITSSDSIVIKVRSKLTMFLLFPF